MNRLAAGEAVSGESVVAELAVAAAREACGYNVELKAPHIQNHNTKLLKRRQKCFLDGLFVNHILVLSV